MRPFLILLSSPSGGGKTTIAKALATARENLEYSVSATTRAPREGEVDGVDYHYLSAAEFVKRRDAGEFLEWAEYGGSMYGTLEAQVDLAIEQRKHVILDIEVQGARQVRERCSDVVSIFILPPSAETLVKRLVGRDTSLNEDKLRKRLLRAVDELKEAPDYDYVVINEDRTQVVSEVAAIVDSESRRSHRDSELQENLNQLCEDIGTLANKLAFE